MGSCNEVVGSFFHVGTDDRENAAQRDLGDTFNRVTSPVQSTKLPVKKRNL